MWLRYDGATVEAFAGRADAKRTRGRKAGKAEPSLMDNHGDKLDGDDVLREVRGEPKYLYEEAGC